MPTSSSTLDLSQAQGFEAHASTGPGSSEPAPDGTAAEATARFEQDVFSDLINRAVNAAYEKAKKLNGQCLPANCNNLMCGGINAVKPEAVNIRR